MDPIEARAEYPAVHGETVTHAHMRKCADRGHAPHVIDGHETGLCARCGEPLSSDANSSAATTATTAGIPSRRFGVA